MLTYKKGTYCFNIQFLKDKIKKVKKNKEKWQKFDPPPRGFEPRIFKQIFPAQDFLKNLDFT